MVSEPGALSNTKYSASHTPQSICAAGAALVCQSNITLNPKIASVWLRTRFLTHVCVNTCERLHLSPHLVSTPEEFRRISSRDLLHSFWVWWTRSELNKLKHLKTFPQNGVVMSCVSTQQLIHSIRLLGSMRRIKKNTEKSFSLIAVDLNVVTVFPRPW